MSRLAVHHQSHCQQKKSTRYPVPIDIELVAVAVAQLVNTAQPFMLRDLSLLKRRCRPAPGATGATCGVDSNFRQLPGLQGLCHQFFHLFVLRVELLVNVGKIC